MTVYTHSALPVFLNFVSLQLGLNYFVLFVIIVTYCIIFLFHRIIQVRDVSSQMAFLLCLLLSMNMLAL